MFIWIQGKLIGNVILELFIVPYHGSPRWKNVDSSNSGLILGLRPANERRRYFVTTSLNGWAQA